MLVKCVEWKSNMTKEEYEEWKSYAHPSLSSIDLVLHECLTPDLCYTYKLTIKIVDVIIVLYFDKDSDRITHYDLLSEDGSMIKITNNSGDKYISINGSKCTEDVPSYEPGTVLRYLDRAKIILGIHEGKINARFERNTPSAVSVIFNLDTHDMEHNFNVAAADHEIRPVCTFEYKKDLLDMKVAKSLGLVFEHKIL